MFRQKEVTLGDVRVMDPDKKVELTAGNVQMLIGLIDDAKSIIPVKKYKVVSELNSRKAETLPGYMTPLAFINSGTSGDVVVEAQELKLFLKDHWVMEDKISLLQAHIKDLEDKARLVAAHTKMQHAIDRMDAPERIIIKGGKLDARG